MRKIPRRGREPIVGIGRRSWRRGIPGPNRATPRNLRDVTAGLKPVSDIDRLLIADYQVWQLHGSQATLNAICA